MLIPLIALNDIWKIIDYAVYKSFYLDVLDEDKKLRSDINLIDLPYELNENDDKDWRKNYRTRLADLLFQIDSLSKPDLKPKAVILDIYFSRDKAGLDILKKAIAQLTESDIKVYAVFNMKDYRKEESFEARSKKLDAELYDVYFEGGRLHNIFNPRNGIVNYKSFLLFEKENSTFDTVYALPFKVAKDYDILNNKISDFTQVQSFVLPLGNPDELVKRTYTFQHEPGNTTNGVFIGPNASPITINGVHLIVGSLDEDQIKEINQSGPHLLAWALDDQLKDNPIAKQPLNSLVFVLAMVLFFSLFVALIYALVFKYVKKLQTKPWLISLFSFAIGMLILFGFGFLLLEGSDYVIPVGLTLISMLVVSILSWHYYNKFLVTKIAEGSGKYDVFISYSHAHKDWVKQNVYQPLTEFKKKSGKELNIFFDEKSIGFGEAFTTKYMWGIVDSKVFVPIISEDYYGKSHCKNELDLAYFRTLENPPLVQIYPIALKFEYVPEIYRGRLANVVEGKEDFIQSLLNILDEGKD